MSFASHSDNVSKVSSLGIIAGTGQFPFMVAKAAAEMGIKVSVCCFHGYSDANDFVGFAESRKTLHIGQLGKTIKFFKKNLVSHVCFAGAISKPKALSLRPDFRALKLLIKLRSFGDDAVLRGLAGEFESDGLKVIQAARLVPGLAAPSGILTNGPVEDEVWEDILYGWPLARNIGAMDIGQCISVKKRMVVAVECLEGTDAMLERASTLAGSGCVAIKIVKPGQDERLDLPAIGLKTIENLVKASYACLVYEAGKTLFFDREQSVEFAEANKLLLVGIPADEEWGCWPKGDFAATKSDFLAKLAMKNFF